MHPDVIAQTDKINEGNRQNLVELKVDLVGILQKRQRDVGRYKAMQYFCRTSPRDSPGWTHCSMMGRWSGAERISKFCVIL
jgi:hypothetical protein